MDNAGTLQVNVEDGSRIIELVNDLNTLLIEPSNNTTSGNESSDEIISVKSVSDDHLYLKECVEKTELTTKFIVSPADASQNLDTQQQIQQASPSEELNQNHEDNTTVEAISSHGDHSKDNYDPEIYNQSASAITSKQNSYIYEDDDYIIEIPPLTSNSSRQIYQSSRQNGKSLDPKGTNYHKNVSNGRIFKSALHSMSNNNSPSHRHAGNSPTSSNSRKRDEFSEWMCSRSPEHSLWCSRIYEQRNYIYHVFDQINSNMEKLDDLDVLHELIERTQKNHPAQVSINKWEDNARIDRRLKDLKFIFEFNRNSAWSNNTFSVTPPGLHQIIERRSIQSYFDFGCGDGVITAAVGHCLNLSKENIFGADVYSNGSPEITFIKLNENQSGIKLPENHVDLITSFVTFHHVSNVEETCIELARILRSEGYLILREHDCKTEYSLSTKYLNFVHAIMMIAGVGEFADSSKNRVTKNQLDNAADWEEQKWYIIQYAKTIHYRTGDDWRMMLENVGFHHRATLSYGGDGSRNPQNLFYAVYQLQK
ncbi:hypothetical protein I4U23_017585 [Adineta vaga]|nr:hypothetical protein I4U23_017585 [Adineta vaga]